MLLELARKVLRIVEADVLGNFRDRRSAYL